MSRNKIAGKWMVSLIGLLLVVEPGCRQKEPEGDTTANTVPASESVVIEDPAPQLIAADEQDAEDAPFFLPRTDMLRDWVKTQAIRTGPANAAERIAEAEVAKILTTFKIERISACTYEQPELKAEVLAIETLTPDDAFGIFSVLADAPWIFGGDRGIRAKMETAAPVWFGWQGRCFVRVRGEGRINPRAEKALGDLLAQIVFYIPAADAPLLARAIPPADRAESRVWLVRDLRTLREQYPEPFRMFDPQAMNERLGMTGDVLFSVARVRRDENKIDDLIWLAKYPNAAAAKAAHARYRKALNDADDRYTLLLEPQGTYCVGGWSGRGTPVQQVLNELRETLPIEETQP